MVPKSSTISPIDNNIYPFIKKKHSMGKQEEQITKGDDVIVELDASHEDLYSCTWVVP